MPEGRLAALRALAIPMIVRTSVLREDARFESLLNERPREKYSAVRPPDAAGTELGLRSFLPRLGLGKVPLNSCSALPVARAMFGTVRSGLRPLHLHLGAAIDCAT